MTYHHNEIDAPLPEPQPWLLWLLVAGGAVYDARDDDESIADRAQELADEAGRPVEILRPDGQGGHDIEDTAYPSSWAKEQDREDSWRADLELGV